MPSLKQKRALTNLVENGGNVSKAMIEAGYSPATAKTPQKLTESQGFLDLVDEYLPDEILVKVHKEGLQATTKKPHLIDRDDKGRPIYEYVGEADYATRHRYLDSAYKLKGLYAPDKSLNLNINADITPQNEKAKAIAQKYEEELLNTIQ